MMSPCAPLQDAGIKTADAVVLGGHEKLPHMEGDALVLASLLQVGAGAGPWQQPIRYIWIMEHRFTP